MGFAFSKVQVRIDADVTYRFEDGSTQVEPVCEIREVEQSDDYSYLIDSEADVLLADFRQFGEDVQVAGYTITRLEVTTLDELYSLAELSHRVTAKEFFEYAREQLAM